MAKTTQPIEAVFPDILSRISAGELLTDICDDVGFTRAWFYKWLNEDEARVDAYARARDIQQESWADDIVKISEDSLHDTKEREDGSETMDGEWVARCKLRVDTKKWLMAKLAPRRYGDKQAVELSGKDGGPIQTTQIVVHRGKAPKAQ
jgi:hypothetical protein